MSSDNGYVIRKHPNGGFAAIDYSMSVSMEDGYDTPDGYPLAQANDYSFPTVMAALEACNNADFMDTWYSEYGAHLDKDCTDIQDALLHELHEEVTDLPNWSMPKVKCTCGVVYTSHAELWKHQANALREQLKQLG